ncbi:MAG: hypothetical protein AB8B50_05590 [Pirellulaceae bacterium]
MPISRCNAKRNLAFEPLESRKLLAADLLGGTEAFFIDSDAFICGFSQSTEEDRSDRLDATVSGDVERIPAVGPLSPPENTFGPSLKDRGEKHSEHERFDGEVVGAHVLYLNSAFDQDGTAADKSPAVAQTKAAYRAGDGQATAENYTNYSRGLNGIAVDVVDLPGEPTLADFIFKVGNGNDPSVWGDAPVPRSVEILPEQGVGGADRILVIFEDGAIQNQWLEVSLLANERTGLADIDVHYWGNLVGQTTQAAGEALVDHRDSAEIREAASGFDMANLDSRFDLNKDRRVDVTDHAMTQLYQGESLVLLELNSGNGGNSTNGPLNVPEQTGEGELLQPGSIGVRPFAGVASEPAVSIYKQLQKSSTDRSNFTRSNGSTLEFSVRERVVASGGSYFMPIYASSSLPVNAVSIAVGLNDGGAGHGGSETALLQGVSLDQTLWDIEPAVGSETLPGVEAVALAPAGTAASLVHIFGSGVESSVIPDSETPIAFVEIDLSGKTHGEELVVMLDFAGHSAGVSPGAEAFEAVTSASGTLRLTTKGDANGDGEVNESDVNPFLQALTNRREYAASYPAVDPASVLDFTGDGRLTNTDIAGFLSALGGE